MRKKGVRRKKSAKKAAKKVTRKKPAAKRATKKKASARAKKTAGRKSAVAKKSARRTPARKKAAPRKTARPKKVSYMVPPFHSVTPHIVVRDVPAAIGFYKRAFGAVERFRVPSADGRYIMHAEIMIGGSVVMMTEEMPGSPSISPTTLGGSPVFIHLYVPNTDTVYSQALAAGAIGVVAPADMFWGDRFSQVTDPFGHKWSIATHLRDPSAAKIAAGAAAMGQSR